MVAVFESGSVIVTGAREMRQAEDAHRFIVAAVGQMEAEAEAIPS